MLTRRNLLGATGAQLLFAAAPSIRVESTDVISHQPEFYHGWPTVTRRKNGDLLLVCSGGREAHVCPFGRVELMRSRDEGKNWSWPEVLWDSAIDDRDAGICETAKGSLLVTTFTSLAYEAVLPKVAQKSPWWAYVNMRTAPAQRKTMLGCWMTRSTDNGYSWSTPYRVPVNSPHGPTQLADGRILYAGKQLWQSPEKIGVAESLDDGRTWRWLADIPAREDDKIANYHELHAIETADKRIVVHIRNHNSDNDNETLQSESADGGKTWSVPKPIGVWGLPSHLLRLRNDRLLMSYGHRQEPFGVLARLSEDHGRTWSEPLVISKDGAGVDLGYPSTAELAGGSFLTVWYELLAGSTRAVLRQARWRME